jgi:hypothetical protein
MSPTYDLKMWVWLAVGLTVVSGIARGFWLYRASLKRPTADGEITRVDIERRQRVGATTGHYFCAMFASAFAYTIFVDRSD